MKKEDPKPKPATDNTPDPEVIQETPPADSDATVEADVTSEADRSETEARTLTLEQKLAQAEASLAEAEQKTAEYLDGWQRAQAAFANYRKRTEAEQGQWRSTANAALLARLLPVLDDFKRAFEAVPEAYQEDQWLNGIRLVQRKLESVLKSENVTPIEIEPGDAFDPNYHEAVLYQEVEGFGDGEIVTEIETGYLVGERILRPSLVVVAKGATEAPAASEDDEVAEDVDAAAVVEVQGTVVEELDEDAEPKSQA